MAFCNKCGAGLTGEDLFCPNCGNKIDTAIFEEDKEPELPSMTKEESIALAEKLSAEYGALEKLIQEISEAEAIIKRPLPEAPRHSAFKFFWPFIVTGLIIYLVIYLIIGVVFLAGGSESVGSALAPIVAFIALGATLAIGGSVARNKRDTLNNQEALRVHALRVKIDEMKKRTSELKTSYSVKKRSLAEYDAIVPASQRTKVRMDNVRRLIESGKADNFYDALKL